uniref:Uncharacterized protein n=1 Tax=Callorhinchus milii TaxID=7868 RepID=A0A4W3INV1_CALMI
CILIHVFYCFPNIAIFLTCSGAVAVTWADRVILAFSWIIPLSVAISTFGSINSTVFVQGRLNFAVSREGHLPIILSMLHTQRLTPVPAIILSTILSIIFIIPTTLLMLTNYSGFISWLLIGLTCVSLIVLRFKEPHLLRPYKVSKNFFLTRSTLECNSLIFLPRCIKSPLPLTNNMNSETFLDNKPELSSKI